MITKTFFGETVGSREHTTPVPDQIEAARRIIRARRIRREARAARLATMEQELASVKQQLMDLIHRVRRLEREHGACR